MSSMYNKHAPTGPAKHAEPPSVGKRRFARAPVNLPATYAVTGRAADRRSGRIIDLSGGGVRFEADEDLAGGTVIELEFEIPGSTIVAKAHVVLNYFDSNAECFGHGLAFTAIDPAAQEAIADYVLGLKRP
ncbi:MAG: PilZ domain-containing protein [Candidatus Velthaea sp.]